MKTRLEFSQSIAKLGLTHTEKAIALLWYYHLTKSDEEMTASKLAIDLHNDGFPKPNVTRLNKNLKASKYVVKGKTKNSLQLNLAHIIELDEKYQNILDIPIVNITNEFLPTDLLTNDRRYLEKLWEQINGCFHIGYFDACAVLCRRLMESLLIEIYISQNRHQEIQHQGNFLSLENIINFIIQDNKIPLKRSSPKIMKKVKKIGDFAAHDRTHVTNKDELKDLKLDFRALISELLILAGL